MTSYAAFTWLVHGSLASTVLLALCALGTSIARQPADRLRLIQWSLAATLGALMLFAVPQFSLLSLGILTSTDDAPQVAEISVATNFEPDTAPALQAHAQSLANSAPRPAAPEPSPTPQLRGAGQPAKMSAPTFPGDHLAALARRAVCIAYLLGMAMFLVRWVLARVALARLLRGAHEVPAQVHAELARIAGIAAQGIRLLASPTLGGPVTWGTSRPVIVIPSAVLRERDPARLRYYLAHEWGHVSRRDFATWQFATLLQVLLYYQPLFWWVRNRLAVCMDQLADADASDQGESTADYADFLVELARLRMAPHPQLSLGISDRKSGLYQRVLFLINRASRPRPTCPRRRSLCIGAAALLLAALVSVVRLDAEPAAAPQPPAQKTERPATGQPPATRHSPYVSDGADGSITYTGEATDAATGQPIPGVKVTVHHKESNDWKTLKITDHETGPDGRYSFVVPPEEAALDLLYIEVEGHHPNFASHSRSGYSHAMIRKNLELGEDPFYAHIRLWPGEAIIGTVVTPDGEPLADVEVSIYASTNLSKKSFRGSWDKVKTDAQGVFRIVPATPGDGVLWIKPEKYAPQAHRIGDRRGDWGKLTVQKGADLTGRVFDVQGAPVANVKLEARRNGDGEKSDEYLHQNSVAGQIGRETVTGAAGEFTLASLPTGDYTLEIRPNSESYDPDPLDQVFLRTKIAIVEGSQPNPLEIRAVPHVVIHGQYLDSAGKPRRGSEVSLFGKVDGGFFYVRSNQPGNDGKFEIRAPHGITDARLDLITNEHSSLRWRLKPEQPLNRGRDIKLGTLEDDVTGFEVVRYVAPIVLVKAVDEARALVKDYKPILKYTRPQGDTEQLTVYTTGSHVSFEQQEDGRWRSSQLLPDEPISVAVEMPGYTTTAQELSLPEREERELTFVLKKVPEDKKREEKKADEKKADEK